VVDEADRLLSEHFQDWLRRILQAVDHLACTSAVYQLNPHKFSSDCPEIECDLNIRLADSSRSTCQKLLFSATMTRDPGKLKELSLNDVRYFVVGSESQVDVDDQRPDSFELPTQLVVRACTIR
jgi:ATP-dependent RNA helicase DDX51/DBP6